jgi:hypothetical protein
VDVLTNVKAGIACGKRSLTIAGALACKDIPYILSLYSPSPIGKTTPFLHPMEEADPGESHIEIAFRSLHTDHRNDSGGSILLPEKELPGHRFVTASYLGIT